MEKTWIIVIAISIFILTTLIYYKITRSLIKKKYGHNWKKWGARMFYWQDAIYICTGVTFLVLALMKWTNFI